MAAIAFDCPNCGHPLKPDGRTPTVLCPACNSTIIVPPTLLEASAFGEARTAPEQQRALTQIEELVKSGRTIEAIKRYRELFGVSLKDAKEAVEWVQRGNTLSQKTPSAPTGALAQVHQLGILVREGKTAEAAQLYQQLFGGNLSDAQMAVETMLRGRPVYFGQQTFSNTGGARILVGGGEMMDASAIRTAGTVAAGTTVATTGAGCGITFITLAFILGIFLFVGAVVFFSLPGTMPSMIIDQLDGVNPIPTYANVVMRVNIGGNSAVNMEDPRQIGVDGAGNIYVNDYGTSRVAVLNASGEFIREFNFLPDMNQDTYITDMRVMADSTIYVLLGTKLYRYNGSDGSFINEYLVPRERYRVETFDILPDGTLALYLDDRDDEILVLDPNGRELLSVPQGIEAYTNRSDISVKIAIDAEHNVYLLGRFTNAVIVIDANGQIYNRIDSPESGQTGAFTTASEILVDSLGRIYLNSFTNIIVYSRDGQLVTQINARGVPFGLFMTPDGNLYTATNSDEVVRLRINDLSE